jgi:hypothetical protein
MTCATNKNARSAAGSSWYAAQEAASRLPPNLRRRIFNVAKVCKRGHEYAAQPGGRYVKANGKPKGCKECRNVREATPGYIAAKKARTAKWRAANTEYVKAYDKARGATPERIAAKKVYGAEHPVMRLLSNARARAKKRGLPPPTITLQWIAEQLRTVTHCPLSRCGRVRMIPNKGKSRDNSPSLDQRDVRITYTPENTALICQGCNLRKGDMLASYLRELADYAEENSWLGIPSEMKQTLAAGVINLP